MTSPTRPPPASTLRQSHSVRIAQISHLVCDIPKICRDLLLLIGQSEHVVHRHGRKTTAVVTVAEGLLRYVMNTIHRWNLAQLIDGTCESLLKQFWQSRVAAFSDQYLDHVVASGFDTFDPTFIWVGWNGDRLLTHCARQF